MKFGIRTFGTVLALLGLVACGGGGSKNDQGTLTVSLTDAPKHEIRVLKITIEGVSLKPSGGPPIEYLFEPRLIELSALTGGVTVDLLHDQPIPAGTYQWVALHVIANLGDGTDDAYVEYVNENGMEEVEVPSGAQSGLRIFRDFTVTANQNLHLTIDWNLDEAVVRPAGQPGTFLRPALRLVDNAVVGTLTGTVHPDLVEDPDCETDSSLLEEQVNAVYVFDDAGFMIPDDIDDDDSDGVSPEVVAPVTHDGTAYRFTIPFLEASVDGSPRTYTVAFTCDAVADQPDESNHGTIDTIESVAVSEVEFPSVVTGVTLTEGATSDIGELN